MNVKSRLTCRKNCSVSCCERLSEARGYCLLHYQRWKKHGDPLKTLKNTGTVEERFYATVDKNGPILLHCEHLGPCWVWFGSRHFRGYGSMSVNNKNTQAHRISYSLANGQLSSGLCVLHRCDNPSCVNPDHLFLGTDLENNADCVAKNRQAKGEGIPTSKLSEEDVREIRKKKNSVLHFARRFRVSPVTILKVLNGKTWKHVKE